ncbi:hypothetical protein D6I95_13290 [Alcaligenes faecalis]|nr:hypothetical protein D6I95_13290 [Alcaligenes faecalis]
MGVSAKNVLKRCICCSAKNKIQRFFFYTQEFFANMAKKIRDLLSQAPYNLSELGAVWQDRCTCRFA